MASNEYERLLKQIADSLQRQNEAIKKAIEDLDRIIDTL